MTPETYKIKEKEKNNARQLKRKAFMEKLNEQTKLEREK